MRRRRLLIGVGVVVGLLVVLIGLAAFLLFTPAGNRYLMILALDPCVREAGEAYTRKELNRALTRVDECPLAKPQDGDAHNLRALTLALMGDYVEALQSADRAVFFKPDFASLDTRAYILLKRGQPVGALADIERMGRMGRQARESYFYPDC